MSVVITDRLSLREFQTANSVDSTSLLGVFGDAEVMRYADGVKPPAWIKTWLLEAQRSYRTHGYGNWAVTKPSASGAAALLGYCGLSFETDLGGHPEVTLGYRLARRYWGQGYASKAVNAVLAYGFGSLGLRRIVATIDPGNAASVRVAEKARMVYEKDFMASGYTHPDRLYVRAV